MEFHIELFFQYISSEKRLSPHTFIAYKNDMQQFIDFMITQSDSSLTSVSEVRHTYIRAWIVQMMEKGISPRSINRRLSCLKTYFKFLLKRQHITVNPMTKVVSPKTAKRLPSTVTERNLNILLEQTEWDDTFMAQRDRAIIETFYGTGMRLSELTSLTLSSVDIRANRLKVIGKGNKERLIPFGKNLSDILEGYLKKRNEAFPNTLLTAFFLTKEGHAMKNNSVYNVVKKNLGFVTSQEKRSPHVLRHSFATHLSENGADLNAIKDLLGHSSLAATQVYMHNSVEKLKKAYAQAHPKSGKDN